MEKCVDFKKDIWFELGKCMWRKHHSIFQDHLKYICNDIVKSFRVGIIWYADRVQYMYNLANHLPPHLIKGNSFEESSLKVRDK